MTRLDFADVLWKKQKQYMQDFRKPIPFSRFKSFQNVFNYFKPDQAVAQIFCGNIESDLYLSMEKVGKNGKVVLIDSKPEYAYERALAILGEENLAGGRDFYIKTDDGKKIIQHLFSTANVEVFNDFLPPYPQEIKDESLDNVMAINAAFELTARPGNAMYKADPIGIITGTHEKLRKGGSMIVQGVVSGDIGDLGRVIEKANEKNGLKFKRDQRLDYPPLNSWQAGEWGRWVKD
jgi:hypothetical protein